MSADPGAEHFPNRTQASAPSGARDTRANTNAGVGPAFTRDVLVATSEHAERRQLIGPPLLGALTERRGSC